MPDPIRTDAARRRPRGAWLVAFRRSRLPRAALVIAIGLLAGRSVQGAIARADDARAAWERTAEVWVMRHDRPAGSVLRSDDVELAVVPRALVPADAAVRDPRGERLRAAVAAAEVLRVGRLTDGDRNEIAARLGPDRVGVTIDAAGAALTLGDLVAVHDLLTGARLTASPAEVVATGDGRATLAVVDGDVGGLIRALTTGGVVPVLVG